MKCTKNNIWEFAQNKPTLIVNDIIEKYPEVNPDFIYDILLKRGVFKWLAVRRDIIKLKNRWKDEIRELNRKYRQKNKATDILSFQYGNAGEIVICLKEVKKNARRFQSTFKKELARVLIHGILHILGYSHQTMPGKENFYLGLWLKQKS